MSGLAFSARADAFLAHIAPITLDQLESPGGEAFHDSTACARMRARAGTVIASISAMILSTSASPKLRVGSTSVPANPRAMPFSNASTASGRMTPASAMIQASVRFMFMAVRAMKYARFASIKFRSSRFNAATPVDPDSRRVAEGGVTASDASGGPAASGAGA